MRLIIDLSHYNKVTNWSAVKSAVSGAILRVAYRGYGTGRIALDNKFREYATACKSVGLPFGIYFMSQAINEAEAEVEAMYSVEMAKTYGATLPIFFDSEWSNPNHNGRADGLSRRERTNVVKAFCRKVEELGYKAGVYASESWYGSKLYYNELTDWYIWVADYGKNTGAKVSSIALKKFDMHQYTSKARINGVSGDVDMSECYVVFLAAAPAVKPVEKTEEVYDMPTIKKGSKGKAVKIWQIIVGTTPDGDFGANTDKATREFQKNNKLAVDGIVGKNSWRAGLESV